MKSLKRLGLLLVCLLEASQPVVARAAPSAEVLQLMTKEMADIPGKELYAITVRYPPGYSDPIHRHDAHVFIYVLEGSVTMGILGKKEVTLTKGQTFYEGPQDVHAVSRNASGTKPAKFLVVLVKNKGAEALLPAR